MVKRFNLTKSEVKHYYSLEYARQQLQNDAKQLIKYEADLSADYCEYAAKYLHKTIEQFIAAIITERLGEVPKPDEAIDWFLRDKVLHVERTSGGNEQSARGQ